MATHYARIPLPPSVSPLPFLFAKPQVDDFEWNLRAALMAAAAAERADETKRNSRGRVAYLLCEFGFQLRRRRIDGDRELPVSRADIADVLGITLCRVKRTLALLSLSKVIETDGQRIRVLDWRRLCSVANYESSRLELVEVEEFDDEALTVIPEEEEETRQLTASGEPACFV
jgi:hypothetical protein